MNPLQRAIDTLNRRQTASDVESHIGDIDPRAMLVVTAVYLLTMLSVHPEQLGMLIWFAIYPIVTSSLAHIRYEKVFVQSLIVLPLLIFIGLFNPLYDHRVAFNVNGLRITMGWITFLSIILRGLLSMQALLLLVEVCGFIGFCNALRRLGVPKLLTTQLLMLYRYIGVLMEEALQMQRARASRGYGRKSYKLKMWGAFIGQLLLRTLERSRRINAAMLARGFNGVIPDSYRSTQRWQTADTVYCLVWIPILLFLRYADLSNMIFN